MARETIKCPHCECKVLLSEVEKEEGLCPECGQMLVASTLFDDFDDELDDDMELEDSEKDGYDDDFDDDLDDDFDFDDDGYEEEDEDFEDIDNFDDEDMAGLRRNSRRNRKKRNFDDI